MEARKRNFLSGFEHMFTRAERAHNYIWNNAMEDTHEAIYLAFFDGDKWDEYFKFLLEFYNEYEPDSQRKAELGRLTCKDIDNCVLARLPPIKKRKLQ